MKWPIILLITSILSGGTGWFAHKSLRGEDTPEYHWKKIEDYYAFSSDKRNVRSSQGFQYISPPYEIRPHAEALVAAGEIGRRDIVIPTILSSSENTRKWMGVGSYPDVIHAESPHRENNEEYPVNFTIWYSLSFSEEINSLIESYTNPKRTKRSSQED